MDYSVYEKEFTAAALAKGKTAEYIQDCLSYAKPLIERGLPVIYDVKDFAKLVGVPRTELYRMANGTRSFYRHFEIPKSNGKMRKISAPMPRLKRIQAYILSEILCRIPCHPCAKAYIKNLSLRDNAKFHREQETLLKIDIQDYFPSLKTDRVYAFFQSLGYSQTLCGLVANLCTLSGGLPQGAPTSPYLSNLLTRRLDQELFEYCQTNGGLRYTRYADDITISGSFDCRVVIPKVYDAIGRSGLKPNKEKTHVIGPHLQQNVTGIVVNQKIQVSRTYRKQLRSDVYYIRKFGLDDHFQRIQEKIKADSKEQYLQKLLGRIAYCLQINPDDGEMREYKAYIVQLLRQNH